MLIIGTYGINYIFCPITLVGFLEEFISVVFPYLFWKVVISLRRLNSIGLLFSRLSVGFVLCDGGAKTGMVSNT